MISVDDMYSKFKIAKEGNKIPSFIVKDVDYIEVIKKNSSLKELMKNYKDDSTFNSNIKLTTKVLASYYAYVKGNLSDEDFLYLQKTGHGDITLDIINKEKKSIKKDVQNFEILIEENNFIEDFLNVEGVPYNIIQMSKKISFIMKSPTEDRLLDITDIVDIFNKLEPTFFTQIIVYCNSIGKAIYKVSSKFPVRFAEEITKETFLPNTISIFYEVCNKDNISYKQTVLNFETSTSEIDVFIKRKSDPTQVKILNQLKDFILFEKNPSFDIVSGEMEFSISKDIPLFDIYEKLINDDMIKNLIRIDEFNKPFFMKNTEIDANIYSPLTYALIYFLSERIYPKTSVTFKEQNIGNKKYIVEFKSTDVKITDVVASILSKILTFFTSGKNGGNKNFSSKFFSTVLDELKDRSGNLLLSLDQGSSSAFSSACPAEHQPIIISDEEVIHYKNNGHDIGHLDVDDQVYNLTCVNENFPFIKFSKTKIPYQSGIDFYPCCAKEQKVKIITNEVKISNNTGNSEQIKNYSNTSILNGKFSEFLKMSFIETGDVTTLLVGTCFHKDTDVRSLKDSFIGALIYSTDSYNIYNDAAKKSVNKIKFNSAVKDIRRRMIELPFDVYKQELYDITYDDFVENITNMDHYIDPYLYYRGLEEIFDVNIFTFTTGKVKTNPSSLEEFNSQEASLEIPRCYEYHTRRRNNRDNILIYKNYGMHRSISNTLEPHFACEIIAVKDNLHEKSTPIARFLTENKQFTDNIWSHFYKVCSPILFNLSNKILDAYDDPFSKFTPEQIGDFIGDTLIGQEINIYGKTTLLIFENLNIEVPGIQPILFNNDIPKKSRDFLVQSFNDDDESYNYIEYKDFIFRQCENGKNERVELYDKKQIMELFEVSDSTCSDGCWVNFLGIERGLKILCNDDNLFKSENNIRLNNVVQEQNNVSVLLQLINWLWRSEYDGYSFPKFKDWFSLETIVDLIEEDEFNKNDYPETFLNNLYLPRFESIEERLDFCSKKWPFIFTNGKIRLYDKLFLRIRNLMNVQDFQTRSSGIDDYYKEIPFFITGLIPTDYDYENSNSLIFTKKDDMKKWIEYTNRKFYGAVSLVNMNIINNKIFKEMYNTLQPFLFKTEDKKIYIIQNISDNSKYVKNGKKIAIEIAYEWKKSKINMGPCILSTFSYPHSTKYVVYEIKYDNGVFVNLMATQESNRTNETEYLQIIQYSQGNFAAMLELV